MSARFAFVFLAMSLVAGWVSLQPSALAQPGAPSDTYQSVTRPVHVYRLAPPVNELVGAVLVRPGDVVQTGQPLIRLRDGEARLQVELLELRAKSSLRVEAAKAAWDVSVLEEQESRAAMEDDAVLAPEMRRIELRTERDRLAYELAKQERRELELQLARARESLSRYTVTSPASGTVIAVSVEAGELPGSGEALVELVDTSSLRIEFGVPTERSVSIDAGDSATITVRMTDDRVETLEGLVSFVSPIVDIAAGSRAERGQRLVEVIAPNPLGLPAGTIATVRFRPG